MDKYTKPDFSKSSLITIDVQRETLDGQSLEIAGTSSALPQMRTLLNHFRSNNLPIVHVIRIYKNDGSNSDLCRKNIIENGSKILQENTSGVELASELFEPEKVKNNTDLLLNGEIQNISKNEVIIYKSRWGAFYKTKLHKHLQSLSVNTLVFCGVNFPNCPRTSIYEASERDYKIVLAENAVSGIYEQGKKELEDIGILVDTTKNIIKRMSYA